MRLFVNLPTWLLVSLILPLFLLVVCRNEVSSKCGVRRISGGYPVLPTRYPFVAQITWYMARRRKETTRTICTGVLIHTDFVLTAASCFEPLVREQHDPHAHTLNREIRIGKYEKTFVRAGATSESRHMLTEFQERTGETLYIHSEYLHESTMFDVNIALIRVEAPFVYNPFRQFVRQAGLARRSGPVGKYVNNYCVGIGFGLTNQLEANFSATPDPTILEMPAVLRQFKVRAAPSWYCETLQMQLNKRKVNFDNFYLCAISKKHQGMQHNCVGDIGGPLVCGGLVTGILSARRENYLCDVSGESFSMYSEVGASVIYDWIKGLVPDVPVLIDIPFEDPVNATQWYPDEPTTL